MITLFLKTFVNVTVSGIIQVALKLPSLFARAESQDILKICKMRNSAEYNILNTP